MSFEDDRVQIPCRSQGAADANDDRVLLLLQDQVQPRKRAVRIDQDRTAARVRHEEVGGNGQHRREACQTPRLTRERLTMGGAFWPKDSASQASDRTVTAG
jgi:hypothetical protein